MYRESPLVSGAVLWQSTGERSSVIAADGCVDVIVRDEDLLLAGPSTRWMVTSPDGRHVCTGLRWAPGAAAAVLGLDLDAIRDSVLPLADVVGRPSAQHLRRSLLRQIAPGRPPVGADGLVPRAPGWTVVVRRAARDGETALSAARTLSWSERQVRRRMRTHFGYGYTTLVRIERSRRAQAMIMRGMPPGEVAVRAGYADQSHLTREFRQLVGKTPGQVAGSRA